MSILSSQISQSQKQFIKSSILNNMRIDGRNNKQKNKIQIKNNVLDHLLGSSIVNVQTTNGQVTIYTGVKVKVDKVDNNNNNNSNNNNNKNNNNSNNNNNKNNNNITNNNNPSISLQLSCIKRLSQQQQVTLLFLQQLLSTHIISTNCSSLSSLLTIKQSKKHQLSITIQIYLLNVPHVSYLEYLFISAKQAVNNLRLPRVKVVYNQVTDEEIIQVQMRQQHEEQSLTVNNISITAQNRIITNKIQLIGIVDQQPIIGMSQQQYQTVDTVLLVTYDKQNHIQSFQLIKGQLKIQQIHQVIKFNQYQNQHQNQHEQNVV